MPIPLGILAVAGAGGGALATDFDLLETQVLSSTASSVTFTGLGSYSAYKHLQLRVVVKETIGGNDYTDLIMRLNGVTSASYAYHRIRGDGTAVSSSATTSQPNIRIRCNPEADSNIFGATVIDILDFNSTSKNKTIRALSGVLAPNSREVTLTSGFLNSTSAITSITFVPVYTALGAQSRFSLYGVK